MSPFAINHLALNCRNVAAQETFFSKHFGFKRSRTFNAGKPNEFIMLKLGPVRLELFPTDSEYPERPKWQISSCRCLHGLDRRELYKEVAHGNL
jgi:glyoxylase I family protein